MNMLLVFRLLHVLFVSVWFGSSLSIGGDAKLALKERENGGQVLMQRTSLAFQRSFAALILTFGSGLAVLFFKGGFSTVGGAIHAAIATTLVAILARAVIAMPALARIRKGISGSDEDAADAESSTGKLSMALGIEHLMFLIGLTLMMVSMYGGEA